MQEILDYLNRLFNACENEYDYSRIWSIFWEGVSLLIESGYVADYYDPDTSCEEDMRAWLAAANSQFKNNKTSDLLQQKPWST